MKRLIVPLTLSGIALVGVWGLLAENVKQETMQMTSNPDSNLSAFLAMIRRSETGTTGPDGYRKFFGGGLFSGFEGHPNVIHDAGGYRSSAAGAYQFLYTTWVECKVALMLPDFSPASQDAAAVYLIKRRGAYADVIAGNFESAIAKCSREWASLPGSPYGQPVNKVETVLSWIDEFMESA